MEKSSWFTGIVVSIVLHVLLLAMLFGGSCVSDKPSLDTAKPQGGDVAETKPTEQAVAEKPSEQPTETKLPREDSEKPRVTTEKKPDVEQPVVPPSVKTEAPNALSEPERKWKTYVVKRGDTLSAIAKECDCTVSELAKANKKSVAALSRLMVGQRIKVPDKR